jgi:choline dehydrogenase-like flavoprotein
MKRRRAIHPSGGCRLGVDPATTVVDSFGRTNGTLTLVALSLRSALKTSEAM